MRRRLIAISTDNAAVLKVVRAAVEAYKRELGDPTEFELVSHLVQPKPVRNFPPMMREVHRVAQEARQYTCADIGIGMMQSEACFLMNQGARRVTLVTWPIMAVVPDGPIAVAFPNRFPTHLMEPIAKQIEGPYYDLQKFGEEGEHKELVAVASVATAAWSEMRFPTTEPIEERLL